MRTTSTRGRHGTPPHRTSTTSKRVDHRQAGAACEPARQGAADRQHRERVRLHAAVRRPREALAGLRDKGLVVVGFPSNQFGAQDPGANDEIASFCEINYGVTFPMMAKVDVNGDQAASAVEVAHRRSAGDARHQDDQVELHQVPGRQGRQGDQALSRPTIRPNRCRGDIEAALARLTRNRSHVRARRALRGRPDPEPERGFPADPRPHKVNLSIGIYFDDAGRIPVLDSVRAPSSRSSRARRAKPYLPIEGAANFRAAVQALLFGAATRPSRRAASRRSSRWARAAA